MIWILKSNFSFKHQALNDQLLNSVEAALEYLKADKKKNSKLT